MEQHWENQDPRQEWASTEDGASRRGVSPLFVLGGIGLGAGLMYLLDPQMGKRRRALARDRVVHTAHVVSSGVGEATRDLGHRARGILAAGSALRHRGQAPEDVILERVRSKMGRVVSHPQAIDMAMEGGQLLLSGHVLADEVEHLLSRVKRIARGHGIDNRLTVHDKPGDEPSLQGGRTLRSRRSRSLRGRSPAARMLLGVAGGSLAAWGLRRRGRSGAALEALSMLLLARGLSRSGRAPGRGAQAERPSEGTARDDLQVQESY